MIDLTAPPLALLAERDIDLMVLEELMSSEPFRKWLVGKLYGGTRLFYRLIGVWRTPELEPLGSIDILFVFEEMTARRRCAILIENKIDQPKQDLQAQRYFEFGEKGIEDGLWDEYLTCLFSPQSYFSSLEPSEYFSSYLSYEELEVWFARAASDSHSATPERSNYKKALLRQAINQGTGMMRFQQKNEEVVNYAPVAPLTEAAYDATIEDAVKPDTPTTHKSKLSASDFRVFPGGVFNLPAGYREAGDTIVGNFFNDMQTFSKQYYPELGMKKPTGSAEEAAWVEFAPAEFPRDIRIIHKMPQGFMDLSFAMTTLGMIQPSYQPYLDSDMSFKESGKTAIIRITVPQIDPQQGFDRQKELVGFAMQKAQKLYQLYIHVVNSGVAGKGTTPSELFL